VLYCDVGGAAVAAYAVVGTAGNAVVGTAGHTGLLVIQERLR
jgi:hypothetical protein